MKAVSGWPTVTLGEVVAGTQYGTSVKANDRGVGVPVLRMNNVTYSGAFDLTNLKHVELPSRDLERYSVQRGDILFNRTNSQELVGKMGVWNRDDSYAFAGYLIRLRLRRDLADPAFVAAWFNTAEMKTLLRTRARPSINMSNINATEVLKLPVVRPPLAEQRRLAEVLERAEALRAKRRAALGQLDTLTHTLFLELFSDPEIAGWPMSTIDRIAHPGHGSIRTGPFGSQLLHGEFVDEGVAVLGIDNAVSNEFRWGERRYIPEAKYRDLKRYTVKPGDVLITIMGTCGRCAVVPDDVPVAINTKHLCCITLDAEKCLPVFLHAYFLRHPIARRYLDQTAKGAIMAGLNMSTIKAMPVPVPPLALQREFARRVIAVEKVRSAQRISLAKMDSLFASLQHRAFRGEL